ncbi:MAG: Ig-like domain-containing protein, partial [Myxococcota bacterium]
KVLRTSPTGDVEEVNMATVTFNQPMVALASVDGMELQAKDAPMRIEPQPEGRFRWIGTETLGYEAKGSRFPFATVYTITIPKGTTATSGKTLTEDTTVTFATPRLKVESSIPSSGTGGLQPDTLFTLRFNQRIDHDTLMKHVHLAQTGGQQLALVRTTYPTGDPRHAQHPPERTLVFKPKEPLPLATTFTLSVDAQAPSAEGPLLAGEAWSIHVSTYGPITPVELMCGYGNSKNCPHGSSPTFRFSNAVAPQPLKDKITIEPPLQGEWDVSAYAHRVAVNGNFEAGRSYTLTIAPGIRDVYGQVSAQPLQDKVTFNDRNPSISWGARGMALLESKGPQLLPMSVVNIDEVKLQGAPFEPKDLAKVLAHSKRHYQWNWEPF